MTPEARKFRAQDAQSLLDNKLLKEAFAAVGEYIDQAALTCPADDKDRAQRIVLSKQLLASIKRELTKHIEDGELARIQMQELEKRGGLRLFRR